jgi:hypothetical protein
MKWVALGVSVIALLYSLYVLGFVNGVSRCVGKRPQEPRKRKLPFMAGRFGP